MKIKVLRKTTVCAILLIAHTVSLAQVNLVSNSSFEDLSSCPSNQAQIYFATGWNILVNGGGTPDLFNVCCTDPFICGVPFNIGNSTFQYAHLGNGYSGIEVVGSYNIDNWREYIQSRLKKGLSAGHAYCVKFYASLSDQSHAYIKPLGAYFDNGSISALTSYGLAAATPQVYNTTQLLNDTTNWMKIEGSFTATGNETYITIGNFFTDSSSEIGLIGSPPVWFAYYYIDDISVIDTSLPAYAGNDTLIYSGDSVFIGRQPEIGLDEDCIWFVNGVSIDTVAGLWVWPDSTTTYMVQQTICGNVKWDTVTVSVYGTGMAEGTHGLTRGFRVYPNPATNVLTIESPVTNATLCISNLLGQEVWRQEVFEKNFSIDVSKLGKGIYFIYLQTEKGVIVKKFMKE
ncbi:MAG: T9SS type A sorting domain-containing protein [Bacteroidales bacterium]|nr:T9SS type A sorting domain-containing protein [Bacteroidales bacterium]